MIKQVVWHVGTGAFKNDKQSKTPTLDCFCVQKEIQHKMNWLFLYLEIVLVLGIKYLEIIIIHLQI